MPHFVHLIRHAESTANASGAIIGGIDATLTEKGEQQCHALGAFFQHRRMHFDVVYSSSYVRTCSTAKIVTSYIGVRPDDIRRDDRLVEIKRGDWDGLPLQTITDEVKAEMNRLLLDFRTPGGESMREVGVRMHEWLTETSSVGEAATSVAVFTHGHAIRCLLERLFGIHPERVRHIRIDNTSITTLRLDPDGWGLDCLNSLPHALYLGGGIPTPTPPGAPDAA